MVRDEFGLPNSLTVDCPIENDTDGTLSFETIRKSCTCTNASVGTMTLQPGAKTTLRMEIDVRHRTGPQRFACAAVLKGGGEWSFEALTTIYNAAKFDAASYSFGLLDPGEVREKEGSLSLFASNDRDFPDRVAFRIDSKRIQITELPPFTETVEEGVFARRYPFRLSVQPLKSPGIGYATLTAEAGAQRGNDPLRASVAWNTRSLYQVVPPQVFFAPAGPDAENSDIHEKLIDLRRADGKELRILNLGELHPAIECVFEKTSFPDRARLRIRIDPKQFAKSMWQELAIETDHPIQSTLRIPIAVLVERTPQGTAKTKW